MDRPLRPKGNWLSRRFGPRVAIELTDEVVTFRHGFESLSLRPKIYLSGGCIAAFGDRPAGNSDIEIDVLRPSLTDISPDQILAKFIAHGFIKVLNRSLMFRPNVVLSVQTSRCPVERVFNAAVLAGAGSVTVA